MTNNLGRALTILAEAEAAEIFMHAERNRAAKEIIHYLEFGQTRQAENVYDAPTDIKVVEETRRIVMEEVVRKSRWPDRLTSPQSNEMSLCLNSARAEWLVLLDGMLERKS